MEHNARAKKEFISANGRNYSRTVVICDHPDCGTVGHFGAESDRMAHAHNASFPVVDNDRWKV